MNGDHPRYDRNNHHHQPPPQLKLPGVVLDLLRLIIRKKVASFEVYDNDLSKLLKNIILDFCIINSHRFC